MHSESLDVFHSHMELHLNDSCWDYSSHFSSFVFIEQGFRVNIFCLFSSALSEQVSYKWWTDGCEDVHISSVSTRLCRNMSYSVSAFHIESHKVTSSKGQCHLGPSLNSMRSVSDFKGEVPNDSAVSLLTLVCVLWYSSRVTWVYLPISSTSEVEHAWYSIAVVHSSTLNLSADHQVPDRVR